jgi:phosphatidylserine/phosphatidylglycerophosphate/cardiolipin synthase-like enzyme
MKKIFLPMLVFILISVACTPAASQLATATTGAPADAGQDWYAVYFTDPTAPNASSFRGGPDEALATAIDQARVSVDTAFYDLNLWSIRDALIAAHRRGVSVRVVTESDNMDEQEVQELKQAGIQVLGDRHESLMHDKFLVIDRSVVWTGSMNFTTGGAYLDNNNLIWLQSSKLGEAYTREFEKMFVEDHFSSEKNRQTADPVVTVNGSPIEVYFSPQDGTLEHILSAVNSAQESVDFLAYSFTSDELAQALIERSDAGVTVRGVFDKDQYHSNSGTEYETLHTAGLDVWLDANPRLMHHKVIIIDGKVVITGSYNFSNNAEQYNDENTLIIHDPKIAADYQSEFLHIYELSQR